MKKTLSMLYIFLAAVLWGCIGLFYKQLSLLGFTQIQVVFLRVATAAVCMGIYLLIRDRTFFRIRLKDVWMFLGTGVISLAFFNYCYFRAMDCLSLSVAATLLYTAPIFVMLFSAVLFKDSITVQKTLSLFITFIGCVLVTGALHHSEVSFIGILFGLGSGIGYALYSVFGVYALRKYRTETITFYTFVTATLAVLPLCKPLQLVQTIHQNVSQSVIFSILIAVISSLLPYLLYTKGLLHTKPSHAAVIATVEPIVATLIGMFVFGEEREWFKIIGILLILGAIVLLHLPFHTTKK